MNATRLRTVAILTLPVDTLTPPTVISPDMRAIAVATTNIREFTADTARAISDSEIRDSTITAIANRLIPAVKANMFTAVLRLTLPHSIAIPLVAVPPLIRAIANVIIVARTAITLRAFVKASQGIKYIVSTNATSIPIPLANANMARAVPALICNFLGFINLIARVNIVPNAKTTAPAFNKEPIDSSFMVLTNPTIILIAKARANILAASPIVAPADDTLVTPTSISIVAATTVKPLRISSQDRDLTISSV